MIIIPTLHFVGKVTQQKYFCKCNGKKIKKIKKDTFEYYNLNKEQVMNIE